MAGAEEMTTTVLLSILAVIAAPLGFLLGYHHADLRLRAHGGSTGSNPWHLRKLELALRVVNLQSRLQWSTAMSVSEERETRAQLLEALENCHFLFGERVRRQLIEATHWTLKAMQGDLKPGDPIDAAFQELREMMRKEILSGTGPTSALRP